MSYLRSGEWRVSGTGKLPMTELLRGSPPGNAGVPPAQIYPQSLAHLPPPGSTGTGAKALLRPGNHAVPAGRVAGCAIAGKPSGNPREEDAGGTPALPGGPLSSRLPFKGESAQTNRLDGLLKSRFDNPFVALRRSSGSLVDYSFSFCLLSFVSNNWRGGSQGAATGARLSIASSFRYSAAGSAKQELRVSPWLRSDCNI